MPAASPQVTFHGVDPSEAFTDHACERVRRLERLGARVHRCRVAVERPHHHHQQGDPLRVTVELTLPGDELVERVERPDAYAALGEAFDHLRRRLVTAVARRRSTRRDARR